MAGLLGDIYSASNTLKRKVNGLLSDPMGTAQQFVGQLGDDTNTNINNMLVGHGLFGNKSVLTTPQQAQAARAALADYGAQSGIAGMFVGKGSKTWDAISAKKAEQMAAQGVDPRKVWSETGTWKGPDGVWRQEIPDNAAAVQGGLGRVSHDQMKAVNGGEWINENNFLRQHYKTPEANAIRQRATMTSGRVTDDNPMISDVINHPSLLNAYGDLGNIPVAIDNKMPIGNAALGKTPRGGEVVVMSPTNDNESISNAIHEMQHAIQHREGWAQGGSAEGMPSILNDLADQKFRDMRKFNGMAYSGDPLNLSDLRRPGMREKALTAGREAQDYKTAAGRIEQFPELSFDAYKKLAGEAEARATQARIPLDASQRRALFPEDSYDVPMNQLIVRGLLGK